MNNIAHLFPQLPFDFLKSDKVHCPWPTLSVYQFFQLVSEWASDNTKTVAVATAVNVLVLAPFYKKDDLETVTKEKRT